MMLNKNKIFIVGVSTGGPPALKRLFRGMPRLDACILLVLHMPKYINDRVRTTLARNTDMDVVIASDGASLEPGTLYIAPSELHMVLEGNQVIRLFKGTKRHHVCPSVDVTMMSVERKPDDQLAAVIMTGMGVDGAEGLSHIKSIGGKTFAQDEASCTIFGMPKKAIDTGHVDVVAPPEKIQRRLIRLAGHHPMVSFPESKQRTAIT